jgi:hypothetical protein
MHVAKAQSTTAQTNQASVTDQRKKELAHLEWAIQSRAKNQRSCLRLLRLFETYSTKWPTRRYSQQAQDLLAVSFSLWRAAFLADKTGKRSEVFSDAKIFLETIIADNAISYPLDRKSKEWTFNFYLRNARYALEHLHARRPALVDEYKVKAELTPTERWEYCQDHLDKALEKFDTTMTDEVTEGDQRRQKKEARLGARAGAKQRRKNVRLLTEPDRQKRPPAKNQ